LKYARFGLVTPSANTIQEPEFSAVLPPTVSLHTARVAYRDITPEEQERCVLELDRSDRALPATELAVTELAEAEPASRPCRSFGDDDLSGFGALFEPGSGVHRVTGHHRLAGVRVHSREDLPGVDPRPDPERDPETRLQPFVHFHQASTHAERGPKGAGGVVLVRDRDAEGRHHGVADELLDGPALGLDLLAHGAEVGSHDLLQTFGVQLLPQAR